MVSADPRPVAKESRLAIRVHATTNFVDIADHATAVVAPPVATFLRLVEADGDGVVGELGDGKNFPVEAGF